METLENNFQTKQPLPNATAVLVLGIISIVGCFCYGIVGLICGIIALILASKAKKYTKKIRRSGRIMRI